MGLNVAESFSNFCNNLRMKDETVTNIRYRTRRITKQLNEDFWNINSDTKYSFYSGSYGRGTDIFVSDIDLLMRLPYETYLKYNNYYGNGQSALLQEVRNSIRNTYSQSFVSADGQVVKVEFSDGVSFEVVPCFILDNKDGYTYPDTNSGGSWIITNPKVEIEEINRLNNISNKNLKRLCRMIRAWKHKNNIPISGYLIDTLAYQFIKNGLYKDKSFIYYDWMVRDFFKFLKDLNPLKDYWLAPGSNQRVYRKGNFKNKAKLAYYTAIEAIEKGDRGYEYTAKDAWRDIFGTRFSN